MKGITNDCYSCDVPCVPNEPNISTRPLVCWDFYSGFDSYSVFFHMISSFEGEYNFLSNFWMCSVEYEGIIYPSSEHAYVAAKTTDSELRKQIVSLETPAQVKRFGRTLVLRDNWELIKLSVMVDIVSTKFEQHPDLMAKLKASAPHELVEGNTWGDTTWGQCPVGNGKNWLGKILMSIRDNGDKDGEVE